MSKIKSIQAREILDSRGNPTVEVELVTDDGLFRASTPSGVSTGKYEALEIRDGNERYNGMGVLKAVENVNKIIALALIGKDVTRQKEIDGLIIELDGTENKSELGANAILPVSIAVCRAAAQANDQPLWEYISYLAENHSPFFLPSPCVLFIEGGLHAGNDLDIQEFMAIPFVESFKGKLEAGTEIYHNLEKILEKEYGEQAANVGDEGAFAAPLDSAEKALDLIIKAAEQAGHKIKIVLDVAASFFQSNGLYKFENKDLSSKELLDFYINLVEKYPIFAIEDPFAQDDWDGFKQITAQLKHKIKIIGDDLLTTNNRIIKKAIQERACNALIVKPNQVGTVSETIESAKTALNAGWEIFVKHRGGETNDDFIADLSVGLGAKYIMAGAPARGERMAKYNRLLEIEEQEL